jgi:hypothetical protein
LPGPMLGSRTSLYKFFHLITICLHVVLDIVKALFNPAIRIRSQDDTLEMEGKQSLWCFALALCTLEADSSQLDAIWQMFDH